MSSHGIWLTKKEEDIVNRERGSRSVSSYIRDLINNSSERDPLKPFYSYNIPRSKHLKIIFT